MKKHVILCCETGNDVMMQESGEMYLETILILSKQKPAVRSIDICEYMNYSKPSISRAMSLLRADGCITTDRGGFIKLTERGRRIAEKIYERHTMLAAFLIKLGVSEETATDDACKIEHVISDEAFTAIKSHYGRI